MATLLIRPPSFFVFAFLLFLQRLLPFDRAHFLCSIFSSPLIQTFSQRPNGILKASQVKTLEGISFHPKMKDIWDGRRKVETNKPCGFFFLSCFFRDVIWKSRRGLELEYATKDTRKGKVVENEKEKVSFGGVLHIWSRKIQSKTAFLFLLWRQLSVLVAGKLSSYLISKNSSSSKKQAGVRTYGLLSVFPSRIGS